MHVKNQRREIATRALAAIVDSSEDAILSKNLDGIILSWNRGAERLYGYSPDEVIGKPATILLPLDYPNEIPEILEKLRKGERIHHFETRHRKKDGTVVDVSLSISPVRDEEGVIVGASAIAREITQEKKLREFRDYLASIVDSSDDAIISKDMDGTILSWNKGAQRLYGYSPAETIGQNVSMLTCPERPDEIPAIMERLRRGERIEHYETTRVKKNGERFIISLTVSPIKNDQGTTIGASAIGRDITARKRAEEEKTRLMKDLKHTIAQKDVLLQEVYHRVKNNLQVVSSLLELRARHVKEYPDHAAEAFLESINRIRAMALVHEKLYRTENLYKVDFVSYLRSLTQQLTRSYDANNRIEMTISGDSCYFGIDQAIPMGLVFTELITNSFKYAFDPNCQGKIDIQFVATDRHTQISFADNGKGFPENIKFETSKSFGFRIIKLLIKQIGAKISHQKKFEGTLFKIEIPLSKKKEQKDAFY